MDIVQQFRVKFTSFCSIWLFFFFSCTSTEGMPYKNGYYVHIVTPSLSKMTNWEMLIKSCHILYFLRQIHVVPQAPSLVKKISLPPPPWKGFATRHPSPHPPLSYPFGCFRKAPVSIHTLLPNWLKKTVHTPTPEGMCPMPPSPTPLDFLEELQCPNIPPHVVLTVTNNTKAQMLDTLFIV